MIFAVTIHGLFLWKVKKVLQLLMLFKKSLDEYVIEMHSTHYKRKSVVAEILRLSFKNKIYKYMTPISKNVYTDDVDDMVQKLIIKIINLDLVMT